ncbi:MAG: nucleotide sugar dehydrogenase [Bacteroidota bacterium]|nr:nucleotide sugar dehydrogenase [Candidatus Kapabacteria bacterium]MDW8220888.1 nucleotide sugar dehydrogenase [Bacteroidota bacterium]
MKEALIQRIRNREYTVGIIGLGYVGLPLLAAFHKQGFHVVGIDIDTTKLAAFRSGTSYIKHFPADEMQALSTSTRACVTDDFHAVRNTDAVILCVPTPLTKHREPDMRYIINTSHAIAPHLKSGHLVVLESTTYPGTTDEILRPICERISGLQSGKNLYFAFSPEREDPGNPHFGTTTIPKVIGGDGADALELAEALYSSVIIRTVRVSNPKTAEAVKLLENIFRSVNIALVNEMKLVFHAMDIDIHEVIEAAKTKPFGFMPFYPGPGLGGHCIPIDPFYLTWKAREFGLHTRFIELAGEINTAMPQFVVKRTIEALNHRKKCMNGSRILCVGLAYKPDVDDMRESPTFAIMDLLTREKALVDFYDPYIPVIPPAHEHSAYAGKTSIEWCKDTLTQYDAAVIVTHHKSINYSELLAWCDTIIDTRNALNGLPALPDQVWKA